jgi:hypothetical protein
MRLRRFSKGRILKRIPLDFAVAQYFEVYDSEQLGVSQYLVKPQNFGAAPPNIVDTALRKVALPQTVRTGFLYV